MEPPRRIEQAFLHLTFSIKLFEYFRKNLVPKDAFDCVIVIPTPHGAHRIEADVFHTPHDLVLAAENSYSTALGVCAIAMEAALADAEIANSAHDMSERGQLRSFVYQIRNAFAHDSMLPKWAPKGAYRKAYDLRPFGVTGPIDLAMLDGTLLNLDHLGGMPGLEAIRDAVVRWVTTGTPAIP